MLNTLHIPDENLALLIAQSNGEISAELAEHLSTCASCQQRLEQLAAEQDAWTAAKASLAEVAAHEDALNATDDHFDIGNTYGCDPLLARQLLDAPSHPEMLGRLGRYEVERVIGAGGMGIVFKAFDTELHRPVAIKMLAPHLSGSGSARSRFAREARAAAAVVNDHVVPIHNVETEHKRPYLVMQFIAGDSLQARLDREGPLDIREALRIGMQVATGLAAAHAQGLIHRDVKPSNILLDENVSRALLTDFGLARTQDDAILTRSGFHPGTPHYMSPEQIRGEDLDGRSDLFSLGCVLYAICTGHPPFRADSSYAIMRRITDEAPRSIVSQIAGVPEWLERIIFRLLDKDKTKRFRSASEVADVLEQCLAHVQKPNQMPLPKLDSVSASGSSAGGGRTFKWVLGGAASFLLLCAGMFAAWEANKGTLILNSKADNIPIRIMRSDEVVRELTVNRAGTSTRLPAGDYVVEIDGAEQAVVLGGGSVRLNRGETTSIEIDHRNEPDLKSDSARAASLSSDGDMLSELGQTIKDFNEANATKLLESNTPPLTEEEVCACLWWQANHTGLPRDSRPILLEIVLTRRLPPGWSIRLDEPEWDKEKLWHGKPATSRCIEINLMRGEAVFAPIRSQFVSSGLASLDRPNSPLVQAIAEFNLKHAGDQPPLTLAETLAALSTLRLEKPLPGHDAPKLTESGVARLKQVADMQLMDDIIIDSHLYDHEVGDSRFLTWTIKLIVLPQDPNGFGTESLLIRKRFLKVDSLSGDQIQWGKPSEKGIQAGFRLRPAQKFYLANQVVNVDFFYRKVYGPPIEVALPNIFHFSKILTETPDGKIESTLHNGEAVVAGWVASGLNETAHEFRHRRLQFVTSERHRRHAEKTNDDLTTVVSLSAGNSHRLSFEVPNFADPDDPQTLTTGQFELKILHDSVSGAPIAPLSDDSADGGQ